MREKRVREDICGKDKVNDRGKKVKLSAEGWCIEFLGTVN